MIDAQGHNWEVSETGHPFLGWTCSRCKEQTSTQDGTIPADLPKSDKPCLTPAETPKKTELERYKAVVDAAIRTKRNQYDCYTAVYEALIEQGFIKKREIT